MTNLAQKYNKGISTNIDDAIKLLAFEDWLRFQSIQTIKIVTSNKKLAECFKILSFRLNIEFELLPLQGGLNADKEDSKNFLSYLPNPLQAMIWLIRYIIIKAPLYGVGVNQWKQNDTDLSFFSYFSGLNKSSLASGHFKSMYWTELSGFLNEAGFKTNWLHLYVEGAVFKSPRHVANAIRLLNKRSIGIENHVLLDSFMSLKVFFKFVRDLLLLFYSGISIRARLKKYAHQLTPENKELNSSVDLWPLFEDDWEESVFGVQAVENLLQLNLFEAAVGCLPSRKHAIYLQENQSWEFCLIHFWESFGGKFLMGIPHATIRFWDLRYFFDSRSYNRIGNYCLPMPTRVGINGLSARKEYAQGCYPSADLVDVEALRYLHLSDFSQKTKNKELKNFGKIKILVLGDYLQGNTQSQLRPLSDVIRSSHIDFQITFKPHPASEGVKLKFFGIDYIYSTESVNTLLKNCDLVYCSSTTSAAVDAYLAGVPTIVFLDGSTLNQSPLRRKSGVKFVATFDDLAAAITTCNRFKHQVSTDSVFFNLDPRLLLWKRFLFKLKKNNYSVASLS
jgi:surface carbohydrate biosynthesis protein (TIGR04326 family)